MPDCDIQTSELNMPQLEGRRRTVRVMLPPGYHQEPRRRYPVLYMQDGHNLFSQADASFGVHWQIGETMRRLASEGDTRRIIIVGVDCNHDKQGMARLDEYSPWINHAIGQQISRAAAYPSAGGEGEAYLAFLAETLVPWVNKTWRSIPEAGATAIAGSSMGGLFSLYALYERPAIFSLCGAFSSAFWFAKDAVLAHLGKHYTSGKAVYLDIGTAESSDEDKPDFASRYLQDTLDVRDYLLCKGMTDEQLLCVVDPGATHCEAAWARRFPVFINWALDRLHGN
jgi:predicted alpha/beta superfamily hydrolase